MSFDILKWLEDAPIRLVHGEGDPETGGCWMSALSLYSGAEWSDHPECVCPVIRRLCIQINDMLPSDETRGRVIQPHILEPVGTRNPEVEEERLWHLVDAAARRFAPAEMEACGFRKQAEILRSMERLTKENHKEQNEKLMAAKGIAAAYSVHAASAATFAYAAAANAYAAHAAAAYAAYAASGAARSAAKEAFARDVVMPVVLELCAIGSKVPVEPACDIQSLKKACQVA